MLKRKKNNKAAQTDAENGVESQRVVGVMRTPWLAKLANAKDVFKNLGKVEKVAIILLVVSVVALAGYVVFGPDPAEKKKDAEVVTSSYDQINNADYESAAESLEGQIEGGISDDEQRYQALTNLGVAYIAQGDKDKALETLLQAEEIKKDATAADTLAYIARLYAAKDDKTTAINYYKKAINRIKATPEDADDGYIPDYETAITDLGGEV